MLFLGWLGLLGYVWIWSRREWGVGWALLGTLNITVAALLALLLIWAVARLRKRPNRPS